MKNKDTQFGDKPHEVAGMLLYAQTDEAVLPNNEYWMMDNIFIRTDHAGNINITLVI